MVVLTLSFIRWTMKRRYLLISCLFRFFFLLPCRTERGMTWRKRKLEFRAAAGSDLTLWPKCSNAQTHFNLIFKMAGDRNAMSSNIPETHEWQEPDGRERK